MNLLPPRSLLALAAVVDIALHARGAPVAAKALASRQDLMPRHLETLLQDLVRARILKAHRGPRGGYELARERRRVTAGEIVRVAGRGGDPSTKPRPKLVDRVIGPAMAGAAALFLDELDRITVDDLCGRAEAEAGLVPMGSDFAI